MTGSAGWLRLAGAIVAQSLLADLIVEERAPGTTGVHTRGHHPPGLGHWHVYHSVGSTAMGPDDDVVDATLRVRGTEGLRVADTSVFPLNPGNPQGPTMALGWRAADLILNDTG